MSTEKKAAPLKRKSAAKPTPRKAAAAAVVAAAPTSANNNITSTTTGPALQSGQQRVAIPIGLGESATLQGDPDGEVAALVEEVRTLQADRIIRQANATPRRSPLDLLRASPWLIVAIFCLVPLFFLVGGNFTELLLWPLAKIALIVFVVYWADRTLHRVARLHWYSLALLPSRPGEEAEITHLRDAVPVASLVWLTIGAWLRRGLMLAALVAIFAKAY